MDPETTDWQVLDFLARYAADVEESGPRELMHYLPLYPGREEAVAREYLALASEAATERDSADDADSLGSLGPYRLLRELGRGGQGIVYLAQDTRLDRTVALKVLSGHGGRASLQERFRREAMLTSRLEHPGICVVHETGNEGDHPFIAMRHVPGESLATKLGSSKRIELRRVLDWMASAADALHAAHESGVIHRDIKPSNLMVTPEDEVVILDFGLAREEEPSSSDLTITGDVFGTLAYMSPEQIRGSPPLGRGTDIWSLCVVLFQCATGERPFESATRSGLQRAICEEPAIAAKARCRELPRDLRVVLEVGLDKDPARRYATAAALAGDLRCVADKRPIHARRPSVWMRARRWAQRNPVLASCLAIATCCLGFGLFYIETQRAHAVERSERLRQLSVGLLTEVHERVADLPGATSATNQIAQRALAFLQLIRDEPSGDPRQYQRNLAAAHLQVGHVLGNRYHPNLGDPERALVHYRAALELLRELPGDAAELRLLAACHLSIGQMEAQAGRAVAAREQFDASLGLLEKEDAPELHAEILLHRSETHRFASPAEDRSAAAARDLAQGLELLQGSQSANSDASRSAARVTLQARLLVARAELAQRNGRRAGSASDFERARELLKQQPESARLGLASKLVTARMQEGMAWVARDRGDVTGALEWLRASIRSLESLRDTDPENTLVLDHLLRARTTRGKVLIATGQTTEALRSFDEVLQSADAATKRLGASWGREHRTAAWIGRGTAHQQGMNWKGAIEAFRTARSLCTAETEGRDAALAAADLALSELHLGRALARGGESDEARQVLADASKRYTELAAGDPACSEYFAARKLVNQQLAEIHYANGRFREAAEHYGNAVRIHRERAPEPSARTQRSLGILLQGHANCLYQVAARAEGEDRAALFAKTLALFDQGCALFAELVQSDAGDPRNPRMLAQAQFGRARTLWRQRGAAAALPDSEKSLRTMDALLAGIEAPSFKQRLVSIEILTLRCLLLLEAEGADAARPFAERAMETLRSMPSPEALRRHPWVAALHRASKRLEGR